MLVIKHASNRVSLKMLVCWLPGMNVVTVYDFDRDGDLIYLTMEELQGHSLKEVVDAKPRAPILNFKQKLSVIREISAVLADWTCDNSVNLIFIQPGNPQQNTYVEHYNRTVRYDWRGHYLFSSISEVQKHATRWLWTYNNERLNMALGGVTPAQKLQAA